MSFRLRVRKPTRLSPVSMKVAISLWQHTKISSLMTSKLGKWNCAFPAGLHGWAFAKMNESKFGVDEAKMMERLWGGNYFDPATKKWTTMNTGSATCKRGFFQFCYEPMSQSSELSNTCMNNQKDKLWSNASKS